MSCKLSIILPGIRTHNWKSFYNSILDSFSQSFELIIISPYDLPEDLQEYDNIKIIKDYGSPSRCQQIGLEHCEGEFVTWGADDGEFLSGALDGALKYWNDNCWVKNER